MPARRQQCAPHLHDPRRHVAIAFERFQLRRARTPIDREHEHTQRPRTGDERYEHEIRVPNRRRDAGKNALRVPFDKQRAPLAEAGERVKKEPAQFDRSVAQGKAGRTFRNRRAYVAVVGEEQSRRGRRFKRPTRAEGDSLGLRRERRCVGKSRERENGFLA